MCLNQEVLLYSNYILSCCLLKAFVQNFLFDCSWVFENRKELFELIGSGLVIVDNFHSQFMV